MFCHREPWWQYKERKLIIVLYSLDLLEPPASTKQFDCLHIRKFISTGLSEDLRFMERKTYTHLMFRSLQFEHEGLGPAAAITRSLRSQRTLEISIKSALRIVTDYNPAPPSHPTCPTSRELLTGWLGLTSRSSRVRSGSVASVNTNCSRVGDTSRGHCWEGRENHS